MVNYAWLKFSTFCALHHYHCRYMCHNSIAETLLFDFKVAASEGDKILLYWQHGTFSYKCTFVLQTFKVTTVQIWKRHQVNSNISEALGIGLGVRRQCGLISYNSKYIQIFWDKNMIYWETGILESVAYANSRNWNYSSTEENMISSVWLAWLVVSSSTSNPKGKKFPAGLPRTSVKLKHTHTCN